MRSVTRMLLGTAASFVAVAGAQAADLPIKAKPVEYVKVCSLYGAGFWYVPGTDTCIKIGAFVSLQTFYNAGGGGAYAGGGTGFNIDLGGSQGRGDNEFTWRTRGAVSFDMRSATDYGTLRSYLNVGNSVQIGSGTVNQTASITPLGGLAQNTVYMDRAFLQFAGFTAGRIRSFFDMVHIGVYSLLGARVSGDTSANGITGIAYTWQFGGGLSASVSLEDGGWGTGGRGRSTVGLSGGSAPVGTSDETDAFGLGSFIPNNKGQQFFDPVFNIRLDQAWGFVGASAALHDASGGYYGAGYNCVGPGVQGTAAGLCAGTNNGPPNSTPPVTPGTTTGSSSSNGAGAGHPGDAYGWATAVGFTIANPFGLQGDSVGAMGVYSVGAVGYNTTGWGSQAFYGSGNRATLNFLVDGVFNTATAVELNRTWSFQAFYEHLWNSKWRTSIYGGMLGTQFDANAKAMICPGGPGGTPNPIGFSGGNNGIFQTANANTTNIVNGGNANGQVTNCNPDSSWAQLGTRTLWNPVPDLDVGFDVGWVHLNTAFAGTANLNAWGTVFQSNNTGRMAGPYIIGNADVFSAGFRIQRNFLY
jgi:hypothetical protein